MHQHVADDESDQGEEIRSLFRDAREYEEYTTRFLDRFNELIGKRGREATTYEQQREAARLSARRLVADGRFHMTYQHRSEKKNIEMVAAMLYWRGYKDILPAEEATRRRDAYIETLPMLGRIRMGRKLRHQAR